MSEVPRLIVMIMSVGPQGAGRGRAAGESVGLAKEDIPEEGEWSTQQECHVIFPVIPCPLSAKIHFKSSTLTQTVCHGFHLFGSSSSLFESYHN